MIDRLVRRRVPVLLAAAALLPCLALLHTTCGDLEVYRVGGTAVLSARPLYDVHVGPYGFTYPPFAGLLATVPALMSLGLATVVLTAASLASLRVVLRYSAGDLLRRARTAPTVPLVGGLLMLVCCAPVRGTLWNGQVNLLLAALVLADVRGRRLGGVGVGIAAAVKLTPAVFVLYLLVTGRRREARNASVAFLAATLAAWAVLPGDSMRFWTHEIFSGSGIGDEARISNQSLHGLALRLVGLHAGPVWAVLVVPTLVMGLRIARRLAAEGREVFALGVTGVTGCLVSPVSWVHHWVWAIPWLVGLTRSAWSRGPLARGFVAVAGIDIAGWDYLRAWLAGRCPPLEFLVGNGFVLCAVAAALPALGCTPRGRVLNRNWHSSRLSASRLAVRPDRPRSCLPSRGSASPDPRT